MARIIYFAFPTAAATGGVKMIFRHVETLRALGFDAVACLGPQSVAPTWFAHDAPVVAELAFRPDDVLVLPDDAHDTLARTPALGLKTVVFAQNPYLFAAMSLKALDAFAPEAFPAFLTVSEPFAALVRRLYPQARPEVVPCFADERVFRPRAERSRAVAYMPRKRPLEARAIRDLFRRLHPAHAMNFRRIEDAGEAEVAEALAGSALFLSLSRLESVGMAPLEAMACGCLVAGFTGVGGQVYATADNGFWVPEDDCVAAADALAQAAETAKAGGPELKRRIDAGYATAEQWSHARFRLALEAAWMRLAPEARLRDGPLP
jgi:hypothetical protein